MEDFFKNPERWREIRENPEFAVLKDELFRQYDMFCRNKDIPVLKFSDEMEYFKNGVRKNFEKLYFLRRRQMSIYAVLSLVYPENEEYFVKLCDVVAEICNEYSWQVPAHRPAENRNKNDGHSLFAAETALYMAEIKHIFAERFDECLVERITDAIEKKILHSYESRITGVEAKKITNNWAAVCAGSIGAAFIYEAPERFERMRKRIDACMENYLSGISDDGGTNEGASYWNYGLSFYMLYHEILRREKGDTDGLTKEKVKKLANFYFEILLSDSETVSFSDASAVAECDMWLVYFLKKEYNTPLPPSKTMSLDSSEFSVFIRAFLYYNPKFENIELTQGERHFDKLEWYVKRTKNYSFAAKGGRNDLNDNHNHNDIGSFIVTHNGKQVLCDLGSPQYTKENFGKTRYKVLNNSSLGHSVPIVNGKEQGIGDGFCGKLTAGDSICVDLKNAYSEKIIKFLRSFKLFEDKITLKDEFDEGLDIIERFVTDIKPEFCGEFVEIAGVILTIPDAWEASVSESETTFHSGDKRQVYLIDFKQKIKSDEFELNITFKKHK